MKLSVMMHERSQSVDNSEECAASSPMASQRDSSYWDRRKRNNEAAKRSRAKRRVNEKALEKKVVELYKENHVLRAQLKAIREKHGISGESLVSVEEVLASLPSFEEVMRSTRTYNVPDDNSSILASGVTGLRSNKLRPLPALTPVIASRNRKRLSDHISDDSSSCSSAGWPHSQTSSVASVEPPAIKHERTSSPADASVSRHSATPPPSEDLRSELSRLMSEMEKLKTLIVRGAAES